MSYINKKKLLRIVAEAWDLVIVWLIFPKKAFHLGQAKFPILFDKK